MDEQLKNNDKPVEPVNGNKDAGINDKIHLSHDGMFRYFFEKKGVVQSFLEKYLPPEIIAGLDFSTLEVTKDTFVNKALAQSYSDILYYIQFIQDPAYLYFLFEHKGDKPDFPGLQILGYMTGIWKLHLNQHPNTKKLPPIIPLLIYHGGDEWKADTNFISLFDIPLCLEKYVPSFNFELYDISHMPDEEVKGNVELRLILTAFKYIFNPELFHKLDDIFKLLVELNDKTKGTEYLEILLRYFCNNAENIDSEKIREKVVHYLEQGGATMSTLAQQWKEEGRVIGIHEGREDKEISVARNCLSMGMDIDVIAKITELPVERIIALKSTMNAEQSSPTTH